MSSGPVNKGFQSAMMERILQTFIEKTWGKYVKITCILVCNTCCYSRENVRKICQN